MSIGMAELTLLATTPQKTIRTHWKGSKRSAQGYQLRNLGLQDNSESVEYIWSKHFSYFQVGVQFVFYLSFSGRLGENASSLDCKRTALMMSLVMHGEFKTVLQITIGVLPLYFD